ncbi:MAG: hypothetical protein HUJ56_13655, partial [Erysipelotrichaceae bacterium]|nr:hypothetical protein [Erysipelotrichaceae bacterium]
MRKLLVFLLAFLLIDITPVKAEGGAYQLKDAASGQYISGYDTYSLIEANSYFEALMSSYENLLIMKDDEVVRMERGLVTFHGNEGCTLNTEFKNAYSGGDNYVNGCYGFDSAYIDSDGNKVTFFMAGIKGVVDRSLVTLVPYEELSHPVSSYMVKDGRLIHRIKGDFKSDSFIGYVDLNKAPEYLEEGIYYSYDGHYFYENLKALLEDYRYDSRRNAVNSEPYYNYYQYVSHRSYTQIPLEDLEKYFYEDLNISGEMSYYVDKNRDSVSDVLNKSQFYDNIDSFYHYQYQLGSNAVMMLSLATLESG